MGAGAVPWAEGLAAACDARACMRAKWVWIWASTLALRKRRVLPRTKWCSSRRPYTSASIARTRVFLDAVLEAPLGEARRLAALTSGLDARPACPRYVSRCLATSASDA